MLNSAFCQSFSGRFLQRWRPRNLAIMAVILTFLSMSALLLSNDRFTDNYFDVMEKLKGLKGSASGHNGAHPIEALVEQAQAHFKEVVGRQSKSLAEATKEYERRYKKKVPEGFAAWYAFARDNEIQRIDEYDDLMRWMEPFRKVPPSTLKNYVKQAYKWKGMSKWTLRNGTIAGVANLEHDLDTSAGFPPSRRKKEPGEKTPDKDDAEGEEPKKEDAPETVKDEDSKDKIKPEDSKDVAKEDESKDTASKDGSKDTPPKDEKQPKVKRNPHWDISEDTAYFQKRDDVVHPDVDYTNPDIPPGDHPLDPFWHTLEIKYLLDPILEFLPDVEILFNEWDEPRVLLDPSLAVTDTFEMYQTKSYRNAYDDFVGIPCKNFDNSTYNNQTYPFAPYLSDLPESKEVCRHPNIGNNYGMVLSPNALSVTHSLVPMLSMSRISSVLDLTYPNVLYIEGLLRGEYDETKDSSWGSKHNDLYWTGRTSGGLANADNDWHEYHRQRFVATVNGLLNTSLSAEFQKDKDLYKIRFPAVNQCEEIQCLQMTEYFGIDDKPDPFDEVYKHRFQLDIDGNVFSRRFYSLMFSKSTVLKQTWQQEYFDEWLFPWVHYIPVSMDFEELPDMMRFLANTKAGRLISQDVATAGREWAMKSFRAVEGSAYLYRLLLEYAELFKE